MNFKQKAVMFLATGCFIGHISLAPGTLGSILWLPLCFFLSKMDLSIAVAVTVALILVAVRIADEAEKISQQKDPNTIVIDEIAGLVVTLLGLPFNWFCVATGFLIFRLLDIFKPFPIRLLESRRSGGSGIVMDDVAAGIGGNLILRFILFINPLNMMNL